MKVVINDCFGGYSLSPKALKRLCELQGKQCFFYKHAENDFDRYERIEIPEGNSLFFTAFTTDDVEYINKRFNSKTWYGADDNSRDERNKEWNRLIVTARPENRTDPLLIQVIEELGSEEASGSCASLKIVEIPDGTDYVIEEYDGNEHIAERHNTWS